MVITFPSSYAAEWSPATRLTTDADIDWMPSITSTTDGGLWVVWRSDRMGDDEIYYKVFDGSSWSEDMRLTWENHTDSHPSVMQASDGKIWVVWDSDRDEVLDEGYYISELHYKVFDGSSWSEDMRLTWENQSDVRPSVMQASDGKIWVVWESDRTGDAEIFYKVYDGISWSNDTQVTTDSSVHDWDPSIMQTEDGLIWVAFTKRDPAGPGGGYKEDIYYKIFNGSSWTRDFRLTFDDIKHEFNPSIMQTINGSIWVVWDSDKGFYNNLFYKFFDGSTWSDDMQLTSYLIDDMYPSITQATDHTIWVVWGSMRYPGNLDIYYKTLFPHDVAITGVTVPVDPVIRGETMSFNVTAMNRGTEDQIFTVQSYANSTLLGSETIFLTQGQSQLLTFQWNTTGFRSGRYVINATAVAVPREVELDDNSLSDLVEVKILGDICGRFDGILLPIPNWRVELDDFMVAVSQWLTEYPTWDPVWGPVCDLNDDNMVTAFDLLVIAAHYGER